MKEGTKPVNFELALDTAKIIQRDSLANTIHQKDSLNQLSDKQEKEICDLIMYLTNHMIIRMNMDVNRKIMLFEFEFRKINYDSLDFYHFREITSSKAFGEMNDKYIMAAKIFPDWRGNKVTRSENKYDLVQQSDGQEPDEVLRKAWENSNFIIRYHFPAPVKSCSNKLFQTSNDGKTLTYNQTLLNLYRNNPSTAVAVEY
jgi:hypothetical protein